MSLFTNKKFESLLDCCEALEKGPVLHKDLPIDKLFVDIRDTLTNQTAFNRFRIVPYPSKVTQVEEVSVMDLTGGFNSSPKSWKVVTEGEGCRGMFIWVDAPDESDYRFIDDDEDEGDLDDTYGNGHPVMLYWLSDDYQFVTASDRDKNYAEYDVDDETAAAIFKEDYPNLPLSLTDVFEILKATMLYQVAFSCRITKENDDVYKQYNSTR